jgi:hypothetical protein
MANTTGVSLECLVISCCLLASFASGFVLITGLYRRATYLLILGPMRGERLPGSSLWSGHGRIDSFLAALQVPLQTAVRVGRLAVASALLPRFPGEIRRSLLALRIKPVDWQEKVGTKNACNESFLFGSHLSC